MAVSEREVLLIFIYLFIDSYLQQLCIMEERAAQTGALCFQWFLLWHLMPSEKGVTPAGVLCTAKKNLLIWSGYFTFKASIYFLYWPFESCIPACIRRETGYTMN